MYKSQMHFGTDKNYCEHQVAFHERHACHHHCWSYWLTAVLVVSFVKRLYSLLITAASLRRTSVAAWCLSQFFLPSQYGNSCCTLKCSQPRGVSRCSVVEALKVIKAYFVSARHFSLWTPFDECLVRLVPLLIKNGCTCV